MPHDHAEPVLPTVLLAVVALAALTAYLLAAGRLRQRGDAWPVRRDLSFAAGSLALTIAAVVPLPGAEFTAHMVRHLLVGMVAPLLLVLARPLTLALRVLRPGPSRRTLLGFAQSGPTGWLVFPPVAALLDVGGLWLLYRTELFATARHQPWLHGAIQLHVLAAGLLFTFAVCQLDPVRHRHGLPLRAATLVLASAGHAVLAKTLYGTAPPGTEFAAADLTQAAQVMYYGGDLVEIGLAYVIAVRSIGHWPIAGRVRRSDPSVRPRTR